MADCGHVRFNVVRNALYHEARQLVLERINRVFSLIIILLGTGAVLSVLTSWLPTELIGATVATIGALQLVFDFSRRACEHAHLKRAYYELLAEIDENPNATEEQCTSWHAKMVRLTAQEPPTLKALDAIAYNDAADALELPEDDRLIIPWYCRIFAHFWRFNGMRFNKIGEGKG